MKKIIIGLFILLICLVANLPTLTLQANALTEDDFNIRTEKKDDYIFIMWDEPASAKDIIVIASINNEIELTSNGSQSFIAFFNENKTYSITVTLNYIDEASTEVSPISVNKALIVSTAKPNIFNEILVILVQKLLPLGIVIWFFIYAFKNLGKDKIDELKSIQYYSNNYEEEITKILEDYKANLITEKQFRKKIKKLYKKYAKNLNKSINDLLPKNIESLGQYNEIINSLYNINSYVTAMKAVQNKMELDKIENYSTLLIKHFKKLSKTSVSISSAIEKHNQSQEKIIQYEIMKFSNKNDLNEYLKKNLK